MASASAAPRPSARAALAAARTRATDPLATFRPLPVQARYLESRAKRRQVRGPNQAGKTTLLAVMCVCLMLGPRHPSVLALAARVPGLLATLPDRPTELWILCRSWKQSLVVQRKIAEMLPPGVLARGSRYTKKNGFTGARFQTTSGSLCSIVTCQQNTMELASATLDAVLIDEIPSEDLYGELAARVRHRDGLILLHYTPIGAPVGFLKRRVEEGEIEDHHFSLTLDNLTPLGSRFPIQSQEQIDTFVRDCPPWQRPQRVEGAWEGAAEGRWCSSFDPEKHVKKKDPAGMGWRLAVGIDYGLRPGKVSTHLIAVRGGHTVAPEVCYWDERAAPEDVAWTLQDLTAQILDMLRKNDLAYDDIDEWVGDRSAEGRGGKQSNRDMQAHLVAALNRTWSQVKAIQTPRKAANSVAYGVGVMNAIFARDAAWVNPRCKGLIGFLSHFSGDKRDPLKDQGDSARYALLQLCDTSAWYKAV